MSIWDEAEKESSKFLTEPGRYTVRISDCKPTESAIKKTPGLEVHFEVVEGSQEGKTFRNTYWVSQNLATLNMIANLLSKSCDLSLSKAETTEEAYDEVLGLMEEMMGKVLNLEVEMNEGRNGQLYANVVPFSEEKAESDVPW